MKEAAGAWGLHTSLANYLKAAPRGGLTEALLGVWAAQGGHTVSYPREDEQERMLL